MLKEIPYVCLNLKNVKKKNINKKKQNNNPHNEVNDF